MSDIGGGGYTEPNLAAGGLGSFGRSGGQVWATGGFNVDTSGLKEFRKELKDTASAVVDFLKPFGELDSKVLPKVDSFFNKLSSHFQGLMQTIGKTGSGIQNLFTTPTGTGIQPPSGAFALGRWNNQYATQLTQSQNAWSQQALGQIQNSLKYGWQNKGTLGLAAANFGAGQFQGMMAQNMDQWTSYDLMANQLTRTIGGPYSGGQNFALQNRLAKGVPFGWQNLQELGTGATILNQMVPQAGGAGTAAFSQLTRGAGGIAALNPQVGYTGAAQALGMMASPSVLQQIARYGPTAGLLGPGGQIRDTSQALRTFGEIGYAGKPGAALQGMGYINQNSGQARRNLATLGLDPQTIDVIMSYMQTSAKAGKFIDVTNTGDLKKAGVPDTSFFGTQQKEEAKAVAELGGYQGAKGTLQWTNKLLTDIYDAVAKTALPGLFGKIFAPLSQIVQLLGVLRLGSVLNKVPGGKVPIPTGTTAGGGALATALPIAGAVAITAGGANAYRQNVQKQGWVSATTSQLNRDITDPLGTASDALSGLSDLFGGLGDPQSDLGARMPSGMLQAGNVHMDPRLLSAMQRMFMDNPKLVLNSGVRDSTVQAQLYARYLRGQGPVAAKPGTSQHEKGEAIDVGPSSEYGWLASNAAKYGLIKTVTGEPWHFELIGNRTQNQLASTRESDPSGKSKGGVSEAQSAGQGNLSPLNTVGDFLRIMAGPQTMGAISGGFASTASSSQLKGSKGGGGAGGAANVGGSQLDIARTILGVGKSMGATPQAILAAIETGLVESNLSNINYGDRDSLGVFQQRPSQGWGTPDQIMNVSYAAGQFFKHAAGISAPSAGELAADVQRPAAEFRGRYGADRTQAVGILSQLGYDASGVGDPGSYQRPSNIAVSAPTRSIVIQRLELSVRMDSISEPEIKKLAKRFVEMLEDNSAIKNFVSQ